MASVSIVPSGEFAGEAHPWARLLPLIAQGDEGALAQLYDGAGRIVFGIALRMVGEPGAAEDITMEVFLQVWRTAASYAGTRGSVVSWLAMLARTRAIDWLRSPYGRFGRQSETLEKVSDAGDGRLGPEDRTIAAERQRLVKESMAALPVDQRESIELAYYGGLSHSEIAGRLGVPLGTVKTRIRLGMGRLRSALEPLQEAGL